MEKILITGASGQLGTELATALQRKYSTDQIVASDIHPRQYTLSNFDFELLDVMDPINLRQVIEHHQITQIYHLAAILSAHGERHPQKAWNLNIDGLLNVLNVARELKIGKVFWPSSIAVFGPNTPKQNTPQNTIMDPHTVYGISKLAGERWCEYYYQKFGLDIRSLRFPGLISYKTPPGGGTTDYAVYIYHKAVQGKEFTCFLKPGTVLPMMYMPDAVRSVVELMDAPADQISVRSSYNLAAMSFAPEDIAASITKIIPDFKINYQPDYRQDIAINWPQSIDDSQASADWSWKPEYDIDAMSDGILTNLPKSVQKD